MDFGDKYYWRQLLVMSGIWIQGMSFGVILAYPSVLMSTPSNGTDTGIHISADHASWLASSVGISGVVGFLVLSAIFEIFGRKIAHLVLCLVHLISWIIFYFASSLIWLYIGRFFHGFALGIVYINGVIISEYSSPVSRGYFITMMKVIMGMGSLICHFLSLWSWRESAAAAAGIAALAVALTMCWPESPSFYATKGKFEECKKVFSWLHGSSLENKKELAEMISAQMETLDKKRIKKATQKNMIITLMKTFLKKDFQKALLLSLLITLALDTCGRYYVVAFIVQIMQELVGSGEAVYYSIAVDCITIMSLSISCFLVRYINRRTILFVFGFINVMLMFSITLNLYLKYRYQVVADVVWLPPLLLLLQNFIVNVSVIPICFALLGEVFPLEYRGIGSSVSGVLFCLFYSVNIKVTPIMIRDLGLGGTYAAYGTCLAVILIMLYYTVPETKNRTLQEIEDEIKGVQRDTTDCLLKLKDNVAGA